MLISIDVESDGPCPGLFSMISFGAVVVEPSLSRTFKGLTQPIAFDFDPEALAISRISREQHRAYPSPSDTMSNFGYWLDSLQEKRLTFISDNPAYDWQFINYYMHRFLGKNHFGFSARRIGDLWAGFQRDATKSSEWKKFRKTKHTHDPVDDAKGNAEALLHMADLGLRIVF